jgi:hypothetical protein
MNTLTIRFSKLLVFALILFQSITWAGEMRCDGCGMSIPEHAKNHIVLKSGADKKAQPLHVCSLGCIKLAQKKNPTFQSAEFANFNQPDQFLKGDQAFFLKGSEKIKADMGDRVMPPLLGAFKTKKDADAAHKKYGDGQVVKGIENVQK